MALLLRDQFCQMLEGISSNTGTAFESRLLQDAAKALEMAKGKAGFNAPENAEQKSNSRRFVINTLRYAGYNAAICKSRWEQTTGHPAGDYEFIDVVLEGSKLENERFFVDIDFKAQFEIARPTDEYNALLQQLPIFYVGRADKLSEIIKIMCNAARRSFKERGMCIPPWRKYRYMQAKWVGSYKRTTNSGSTAAQGSFLQIPFSGMTLKATLCDASVGDKDNSGADRNLSAKSKSIKEGNEQLGFRDRLLTRGQRDRYENKISGLATAFAEAGQTLFPPSNET
jgi:uncharacterized protein (TIGR01615 family)